MIAENPNNDQLQLDSLCHSANALLTPPPKKSSMSPAAREEQCTYIVILMDEKPVEGGEDTQLPWRQKGP